MQTKGSASWGVLTMALFIATPGCSLFGALLLVLYFTENNTNLMNVNTFIGVKNYVDLFRDGTFLMALKNNIIMVIGSLIAHMPLAMFFANAIFKKIRGSTFFQTVFFLPCVICGVAVGLTWTFIYNGNYGLLNAFLKLINLGRFTQVWLANKDIAIIMIIIVVMWQYVGYHMIIQLAAMRNISADLFEAAEIDGATQWQQFKSITFPSIKPILAIDAVLIITGSLKYYDLIAVMTAGGPNHATEVMSTYMFYSAFNILRYGYSATIGVILLILCMLSVKLSNVVFKTEE